MNKLVNICMVLLAVSILPSQANSPPPMWKGGSADGHLFKPDGQAVSVEPSWRQKMNVPPPPMLFGGPPHLQTPAKVARVMKAQAKIERAALGEYLAPYLGDINQKVSNAWASSGVTVPNKKAGTITFVLNSDGQAGAYTASGSGCASSLMAVAKKLAPFKPLPKGVPSTVAVRMKFDPTTLKAQSEVIGFTE